MKKQILLVSALILLSTQAMASGTGYVRTGVETGFQENAWNAELKGTDDELKITEWTMAEGWFKGSNWGGFGLGYSAKKTYNEDNEHDGEMEIELSPEYGKSTKFGYINGKLIFNQKKWGSDVSGSDTIKPKVSAVVNLTPKSRLEMKALYAYTEATPKATKSSASVWGTTNSSGWVNGGTWEGTTTNTDDGKGQWLEGEIQYKQDLFGGTIGTGIYYGMNIKDTYTTTTTVNSSEFWYDSANPGTGGGFSNIVKDKVTQGEELSANENYSQVNYLLNYAKYLAPIKVYASLYGEYKMFNYKYEANKYGKKDVDKYTLGLYLNRNFDNGIGVDLELVREADLDKQTVTYADESKKEKIFTENTVAIGLKYNF